MILEGGLIRWNCEHKRSRSETRSREEAPNRTDVDIIGFSPGPGEHKQVCTQVCSSDSILVRMG